MDKIFLLLQDYFCFSLIESCLVCFALNKMFDVKKFKWFEILFIGLILSVITTFISPMINKLIVVIILSLYLHKFKNLSLYQSVKNICYILFCMITVEMLYNVCLTSLFKLNMLFSSNIWDLFLIMLPLRLIEWLLIYFCNKHKNLRR